MTLILVFWRHSQADLPEFKSSLVYIGHSRSSRTTQKDVGSSKNNNYIVKKIAIIIYIHIHMYTENIAYKMQIKVAVSSLITLTTWNASFMFLPQSEDQNK